MELKNIKAYLLDKVYEQAIIGFDSEPIAHIMHKEEHRIVPLLIVCSLNCTVLFELTEKFKYCKGATLLYYALCLLVLVCMDLKGSQTTGDTLDLLICVISMCTFAGRAWIHEESNTHHSLVLFERVYTKFVIALF
jgi:hypothetical protein